MLLDRIIRAWKDPEFRLSLSEEEQATLPENPAGAIELTDDELEMVTGGHGPSYSASRSYSSNSASNSNNSNSASHSNNSNSNSNSARSYKNHSNSNSNRSSRSNSSNRSSRSNSSRSSRSYAWRRPR
jgi:mersacidin/lichenicidin family type 2 lantibiotic